MLSIDVSRSCWSELAPTQRVHELRHHAASTKTVGIELNAVVSSDWQARVSDGPLLGMPYVVKDMFDRVERRGEWGGCRLPGRAPSDAAILTRLDAAGGQQIAVTAMSALAYEPSGYNAARGRTLNPWHPDIVCGGSSSGSAAAVAAGIARIGIGSDTGGSIRVPAACCGILGLKPGWGRLPTAGAMELAPSLDVVGLFASRVADLTDTWSAVSGDDSVSVDTKSLAVLSGPMQASSPIVRENVRDVLGLLPGEGVQLTDVDNEEIVSAADAAALTIMQAEAARIHGGEQSAISTTDPKLARRLAKGLSISDSDLAQARASQSTLCTQFLESLGGCDAAVLPVMPITTPIATETDPNHPDFSPRRLYAMTSFTRFVNTLGLPALAIPSGFDGRGAPLALQIVGRPGSELSLLRLASRLHQAIRWQERTPPVHAGRANQDQ